MRETTIPVVAARPDVRSVSDILTETVRRDPEHVAFARRVGGQLLDVTAAQFQAEVSSVAKGLIAAGVRPGDSVAIMSPTRYEWAVADFAIWMAGAVVVPVYETASVEQVANVLSKSGARLALACGAEYRHVLETASSGMRVWSFDSDPGHDLADLVTLGVSGGISENEVKRRSDLRDLDDLASIVFTSGTTGIQKGVRITHGNFVRLVAQVAGAYEEVVNDQGSTVVLLPLAHVLAQGLQLVSLYAGMKVVHVGDPRSAVAAMAEVRPTFMVVVPRVLEKIRTAARTKARERGLRRVFAAAEKTAVAWGEYLERAQDDPLAKPACRLAVRRALFDRLFYRRLRELMGGRIDYLLSGASPLERDLGNFFRGVGVPVIEGYGLTETTAPVTGNRAGKMRAGSVGVPIPGSSVRISEEGEVLVRGVGVSPGYIDPVDNDGAYSDGFFRTGDLGRLDEEGFLYLQGRLKNIIVTANGKNVAPEPWEERVSADPLVAHAVMVGEAKPYVSALVVLDVEEALAWAKRRGNRDLTRVLENAAKSSDPSGLRIVNDDVVAHVQRTIDRANAAFSRAEQVRRFAVLVVSLTEEDQILTPTLKLRRVEFLNAVAHHVDELYKGKEES